MEKLSIKDVIFLAKESKDIILQKWLEELEELIKTESNDLQLGSKIRKLL